MIPIKTIVPYRQDHWLSRQRLLDQIHPREDTLLCLVIAPAGYGKTSLLADFSHQAPFPTCWLSLDESDRNIHVFVDYFITALQRHFPDFGHLIRYALDANPDVRHHPTALADIIAQDIESSISGRFALVLDDFHRIDDDPEVNLLLSELLKRPVKHFYIIIASRALVAGLPIIQLTAQAQITFIGKNHLAFTGDKIQALLAKMPHIELAPEQIQALLNKHQGHITYTLLSIFLHDTDARQHDGSSLEDAPQELDYTDLIERAFLEQPVALRNTMLTLSTLREINETRCQQVLEMSGATNVLQNIKPQDIFLTTMIDRSTGITWFRFYPPIRDFLQAQLCAQDEDRFRQLHQRAADWLEEHDRWFSSHERWERAVAHRLAAGDIRAAAQTMEAGAEAMHHTGQAKALVVWYEMIPKSLRPEFPRLLLFVARALIFLGRADDALPLLHQAEATFDARGETEQAISVTLERAHVCHMRGHYADVLALTQEVLAKATNYLEPAARTHRLAGLAYLNLGRPEEAVRQLRSALGLCRELGLIRNAAISYMDLSFALSRLGKLSESLDCLEQAIHAFRQVGPSNHLALALNNVACERHYLAGNYDQALDYLREALDVARMTGSSREHAFTLLSIADIYRDLGALKEARELYAQAEKIARRLGHAVLVNFALMGTAQILLRTDDVVEALGMAAQARKQAEGRGDIYQIGLSCLTLGAAHLKAGDPQTALAEIERGRDQLEKSDARRDLTRAYILLAHARQASGDVKSASEALDQALDIGIETQTFHYLVVEGQRVFDLFKQLCQRNPADRRPAHIMDRIRVLPDVARKVIGGFAPTALPFAPTLRLYGFGQGQAERDGRLIPISAWRSRMPRRLMFYLLLNGPCSLSQILQTFWPDTARNMARSTFHVIKQRINQAVGRRFVVHVGGLYQIAWDPDCWFDMHVFESLLDGHDGGRQARLEEAVSLYREDFMSGYDAEWCRPVRERLWMCYRNALVELGELLMEKGAFADSFSVLSKAAPIDNLYEPASRALMRLYASDGNRDAAMRHYQSLEQQLRQDLGIAPAVETQALCQAIREGADASQLAQMAQTWHTST